ncbi:glycosyltransferase 87 family protein [Thermococcus sp. 4557]|uniref:glycosyltransferase 87 family protein n=1 Tax=Thermococcus sp. (strain CGMCC 1.5172 / 4557) TaxID=1042877 RepID=UPI0009FC34EB|nr:glycosyltransferase 87 family protein [Thermococcus sp. 4557]
MDRGLKLAAVGGIILQMALSFLGYHYMDGHVLAVSAFTFARFGTSPYSWCEISMCEMWYSYPPIPFLLVAPFYTLDLSPLAARLALKVPALLGSLVLSHAVYRMSGDAKRAVLLLFNPLLLYIGPFRGHFDALAVGLMLESYVELEKRRIERAGVYAALSTLTKQYAPIILLAVLLTPRRRKDIPRFMTTAAIIGLAISAPFLLESPGGYLKAVLGFHAARFAMNYGFFGIPLLGGAIRRILIPVEPPSSLPPEVGVMTGILLTLPLVYGLIHLYRKAWNGDINEKEALTGGVVAMLGLSKVVNIQYFALLAALDVSLLQWTLLAVSGMVKGFDLLKSLPPWGQSPVSYWNPEALALDGTALDGLSRLAAFVLYIPVLVTLKDLTRRLILGNPPRSESASRD